MDALKTEDHPPAEFSRPRHEAGMPTASPGAKHGITPRYLDTGKVSIWMPRSLPIPHMIPHLRVAEHGAPCPLVTVSPRQHTSFRR